VTELVGHLRGRERLSHPASVTSQAAWEFIPTGRSSYAASLTL
jgi:hypothetical protein